MPSPLTRRQFLRHTALTTAGLATLPNVVFATTSENQLRLVLDPADPVASAPAAKWAIRRLQSVLRAKGVTAPIVTSLQEVPAGSPCVLAAGRTVPLAQQILSARRQVIPPVPEALGLVEGEVGGHPVLLACGHDPRGLGYAVLELADRVEFSDTPLRALAVPEPIIEQPACEVRSIYRCFVSDIEDKSWFYDRAGWQDYLTLLATQRINRFSLTLGMGYNTPGWDTPSIRDSYFLFPYPFLFEVPGYDVRMGNLPDAERALNLETLRFISEEAVARGLHFQIGLWSHGRVWPNSDNVNYPLHGLTPENHAPYCRDALAQLLRECPAIGGVTFRVHEESGVDASGDFWGGMFSAIGACDRRVVIDLHSKNVTRRQIEQAVASGMPVTISPKYWGEHQGLGYIQSAIRTYELAQETYEEQPEGVGLGSRSFTRYGHGDYLREDRPFGVLHRVWPGTQRLLLSGDPALAAAYGRVSGFCGSQGFELIDPLTFKGRTGSGLPGGRCAYTDASLSPARDWEKFLYTYRLWGRLGYNPDTAPEVWRRFLRTEFGPAASAVEQSLAHASQVLPLFTTAHGPSPNAFVYWPEIYSNTPIVDPESYVPYQDTDRPRKFSHVSPFDPQLFSRIDDYAGALLAGSTPAKYTPVEVAQRLADLGQAALEHLSRATALVPDASAPAFRRLAADVTIQAGLARFFSAKMRSGLLWSIHEQTGDPAALRQAVTAYRLARATWADMAAMARTIYVTDITFGENPNIRGDWLSRLPAIDADLAAMEAALAAVPADAPVRSDPATIARAVQAALARPSRLFVTCEQTPAKTFQPGAELPITLGTPAQVNAATLCYRRVNQALRWQSIRMTGEQGQYRASIPADYTRTHFPLQYYFILDTDAGPALWPGLDEQFMNQPYLIVRQAKPGA